MKREDLKNITFEDAGDVDLDQDDHGLVTRDGEKVTEEVAERLAGDVAANAARQRAVMGRPSLTSPGTKSPTVNARVPQQTKDALVARAEAEGVGEAVLVRRALEEFLAS